MSALTSAQAERVAALNSQFLKCGTLASLQALAAHDMVQLVGGEACIVSLLARPRQAWVLERVLQSAVAPDLLHQHNRQYECIDPLILQLNQRAKKSGCALALANNTKQHRGFLSHPLYESFYRALDMGHLIGACVDIADDRRVFCTVWRPSKMRPFEEAEAARLLLVAPSLAHSANAIAAAAGAETAETASSANQLARTIKLFALRVGLTRREAEVAELVCAGHADSEIATHLGTSIRTVHAHISAIFRKTGISKRSRLLACAMETTQARSI